MSAGTLRFAQACLTNPGRVRTVNEDCFVARPDAGLWAVADGMGGHENGQWASQTIASSLEAAPLSGKMDPDVALVCAAVQEAHALIHSEGLARGSTIGSTAAALLIAEGRFAAVWAGDSRIYRLRKQEMKQLTRDHTHVSAMVDRGLLTADEARRHPLSHVLSRAIGTEAKLRLDLVDGVVQPGDLFLICSDGLSGPLDDAEIATQLRAAPPRAALENLAQLCLDRGAPDNLTAVAVRCDEVTLLSFA
jgi:serine/threonine-protein phosphatase Stp1